MNKEQLMDMIHRELGERLLERLQDPEVKAADLNVARQFLKDNDIVAIPTEDNVLARLLEDLPFDAENTHIQ